MSDLRITAGAFEFRARWEREGAPKTCEAFERLLPFRNKIIHVRWSGESAWIPLGDMSTGLGFENHTSHPAPGEILLYRAATARPRSCSRTAGPCSRASSASSRATTS